MDAQTLTIIGLVLGLVTASAGWLRSVWGAYNKSELEKTFATKEELKEGLEGLRLQVNGARQAMRRDNDGMHLKFTRVEAEASLAIKQADSALSETHETRQLLEMHHDQMMESFAKPFQDQMRVLQEMNTTLARHGAFLERLMKP